MHRVLLCFNSSGMREYIGKKNRDMEVVVIFVVVASWRYEVLFCFLVALRFCWFFFVFFFFLRKNMKRGE